MSRLRSTDDDAIQRLPLDDDSVEKLDRKARRAVGDQWERRSTAELRVASAFAVIARELFEWGADPVVLDICARAVSDEVRHAKICQALAERYLDASVAWPTPGPTPLPPHERASPSLRPTLYVTAMCCINETIASAWLEASLKTTTAPIARAALRELIADDVHHSRLGWAHLASSHVTPDTRSKVAAWLPRLLDCTVVPWLRDAKGSGDGVPTHGVPSEQTTRNVVVETLEQVVLPGFDAVGVDSGPAREWLARVPPEI
jgi:hypothetical protein